MHRTVSVASTRSTRSVSRFDHSQDIVSILESTVYMLPGEAPNTHQPAPIRAFAVNAATNLVAYSWLPTSQSFKRPHVIRVSADGQYIYVGEIAGESGLVWQFQVTREMKTVHMNHQQHSESAMAEMQQQQTQSLPSLQGDYCCFYI